MLRNNLSVVLAALHAASAVAATNASCKCAPGDACWPSPSTWDAFNTSISGKLIATKPVAVSCYPGPDYNPSACASVQQNWFTASWQSANPVGLDYPLNITCPPPSSAAANSTATGSCTLGTNPPFAVNVTSTDDIVAALRFARENNLRVVVKSTGHDVLGRSDGLGGLEIWLRYFRNGIDFQPAYASSTGCDATPWTGSAMKLGGAYMWGESYAAARENNVVVVGGGSSTVCSTGGWMQGGGHGPASHTFGLGADQVLEAEVVLANGTLLTANACQNQDLFYAIRGGGPGTYGVVVSTTIKAYPQLKATVQNLQIAAKDGASRDTFLDALTTLYTSIPELVEAGFAGYPHWQVDGPAPSFANFTTAYSHAIYAFNKSQDEVEAAGKFLLDRISNFSDVLFVNSSYVSYPDYWSFFGNTSVDDNPVGLMAASGSRLLDTAAVSNRTAVRSLLNVLAGAPGEFVTNVISLVSGGQVWKDGSDKSSAVLPAWRTAVLHQSVARILSNDVSAETWDAVHHDVTYNKIGAMKALAPRMGSYMNEGDALDPDWKASFYGENYDKLLGIKTVYDPESVFYCPTCVGSDMWEADGAGRLCRAL
ncbi:FAD-linked oxidoreductase hmp9 [Colletotrichum siamense]|uniref:FAD-linked oxidoreductase hmp9 n=1 Tax=Colletotrichum siamense TaxID=690259 RepID=A0A9P5EKF5_COLSI|nr:FAD-linked oxidoreductase hmp9 [Colletotrichum siamense]KAF4850141.1 FAD-linked oxidoreductase hmp9 [Colletotrichum siamense]